jgi:hypothetical protein
MIRFLGTRCPSVVAAVFLGLSSAAALGQGSGQYYVNTQVYGYSYASTQTIISDFATGVEFENTVGTSYYDQIYAAESKYSPFGTPPVSPTATADVASIGFRQRGDAAGTTSGTWSGSSQTQYGINRVGVSLTGALPSGGLVYDFNDGTTRLQYYATPDRYVQAQSYWQDLFVVTPRNASALGAPTFVDVTVRLDGTFSKDAGYFSYNLRNFDGTQGIFISDGQFGVGANVGDVVSVTDASGTGAYQQTYRFNLVYGQPFLITGYLSAAVSGSSEGFVDLTHTAKVTSIVIDPNAAIAFASGAPSNAYGSISGGVFGSYGSGGGTLPVPEPESYAMLLAGLGLVGAVAFRRRART